jgi:hypothetical protein
VAALLAYAPRYAAVVARVGSGQQAEGHAPDATGRSTVAGWGGSDPSDWSPVVAEERPGTAGTEFGVPDAILDAERAAPEPALAGRLADLVEASWLVLDGIVADTPAVLRKGPRGGGRDRDPMLAHVLGAEVGYAKRLGLTLPEPALDGRAAIAEQRTAILAVVRSGEPLAHPRRTLWPVRYAARRIAWHVLDHAWEMEDRRA